MRYWIVPENGNPENNVKIGASKRPANAICEIPADEEVEWINLVDVLDPITSEPTGEKRAEVDETAKAAAQSAQADANAWANLRAERDAKLSASDATQLPDHPANSAAWATYRQALRDMPANTVDPNNPTWPTEPGS